MSDEPKTTQPAAPDSTNNEKPKREFKGKRGARRGGKRPPQEAREYEQKILDLARVTRVTAGGKRMSFRCALVIGDKKGRVALGVAKGADVQISIEKAFRKAKKHLITIPMVHQTIPHPVLVKFGSAQVLLKPAPKGTGLKSGGAVRVILELGGLPNAVSKILNSSNKLNIAKATLKAIEMLRLPAEPVAKPVVKKDDKIESDKTQAVSAK
ncbi:30S ribosomal protein S5 [Patescibacteria group bacterium]|nr:30S ribosomal protein S5 [Patescibacteria group bacterium]MBU1705871.1 30S ribosomal protein S5 [Patescibacteria group bacterium]